MVDTNGSEGINNTIRVGGSESTLLDQALSQQAPLNPMPQPEFPSTNTESNVLNLGSLTRNTAPEFLTTEQETSAPINQSSSTQPQVGWEQSLLAPENQSPSTTPQESPFTSSLPTNELAPLPVETVSTEQNPALEPTAQPEDLEQAETTESEAYSGLLEIIQNPDFARLNHLAVIDAQEKSGKIDAQEAEQLRSVVREQVLSALNLLAQGQDTEQKPLIDQLEPHLSSGIISQSQVEEVYAKFQDAKASQLRLNLQQGNLSQGEREKLIHESFSSGLISITSMLDLLKEAQG